MPVVLWRSMEAGERVEHLSDEALVQACAAVIEDGTIDLPHMFIRADQFGVLLEVAPVDRDGEGRPVLRRVDFTGSTFSEDVDFRGAMIASEAAFADTTFLGDARFSEVTFGHEADFTGATFAAESWFDDAVFEREAHFSGASFDDGAWFPGATFRRYAWFDAVQANIAWFLNARFEHNAEFSRLLCDGEATFMEATFERAAGFRDVSMLFDTYFDGAWFGGDVDFTRALFGTGVTFGGAVFERARQLGPMFARDRFVLEQCAFWEPVQVELSTRHASFRRTVFRAGADLRIRWAHVTLEGTDFGAASLVAGLPDPGEPLHESSLWPGIRVGAEEPTGDGGWRCRLDRRPAGGGPRVASLRDANVPQLSIADLDLSACRFTGAHGLDRLQFEETRFPRAPRGPRWTARQTIADEHDWRAVVGGHADWHDDAMDVASREEHMPGPPPSAQQVAGVYRALRKAREDGKDEPGAAGFYYGEMEMRRLSASARSAGVEHRLLWAYWLVAGYGLRASRALLALTAIIVLVALGLDRWGFRPDASYGRALLFAVESSVSLLRAPDAALTAGGVVMQIVLRLAGPLLVGLALLALRSRVKR